MTIEAMQHSRQLKNGNHSKIIRISDKKYQRLLDRDNFYESSADLCFEVDSDGTILDCNRRSLLVLGYKKKDLLKQCLVEELYTTKSQQKAVAPANKYKNHKAAIDRKRQLMTRSGEIVETLLHVDQVADTKEKTLDSIFIFEVIGKRKQEDLELYQKTEDFALINSLNEAVNQAQDLQKILKQLSAEIKRMFLSHGVAIYLLSDDGKDLVVQHLSIPVELSKSLEKLVGQDTFSQKLKAKRNGEYFKIMKQKKPRH